MLEETKEKKYGGVVSTHEKNGGYAWLQAIMCLVAAITIVIVSRKTTPTMAALLAEFSQDTVWGGSLSSLFGIFTAIAVIPIGGIMTRYSARLIGAIGLIICGIGGCMGALAGDAGMFYASRAIEGFGYALEFAVGGTIIARWFDSEHSSIPMSVYKMYVGVGSIVILNVAPPLMGGGNGTAWQPVWWFTGILCLVVGVLFFLIVKDWPCSYKEDIAAAEAKAEKLGSKKVTFLDAIKVPILWVFAIAMMLYAIGMQGTMPFSNMIFTQLAGVDNQTASLMSTLINVGQMASPIIGGALYTIVVKKAPQYRGVVMIIGVVATYLVMLNFLNNTHDPMSAWINTTIFGFLSCLWTGTLMVLAAEHAGSPALAPVGIALVSLGQQMGGIVGPVLIGWFNAAFGRFTAATPLLLTLGAVCLIAVIIIFVVDKKYVEKKAALDE